MRLLISFALAAASLTLAAPALTAQTTNDRDAVRRAVLDYVEGFYEGDTAKLVRSVWPEVRKYGYWRGSDTASYRGMAMIFPQGFMAYAKGVQAGRRMITHVLWQSR